MQNYQIRSMTPDDLPLLRQWLAEPHVAEWWHDAEDFEFVSGDLDHPDTAQFIVEHGGEPFAYLQCYRMSDWNVCFGPQPDGTRGLDQIIGKADMIGRGHGSAFVRQFTDTLFTRGVPRVVLDPRPDNARAIRAYEKAGFHFDKIIETPDGPATLMVRHK